MLALPAVAWALIVLLAPTGWARARLVARLEAATGRVVRIGSVRLGWTGHLRVAHLSFAERSNPGDPWLYVADARVDVHLGQILLGCCAPGEVAVDGLSLRVWRRADGRFEFGDLARCPASSGTAVEAEQRPDLFPAFHVRVTDASIRYLDEAADVRLDLRGVVARGSYRALAVQVDDLRGDLNGGPFRLAARLTRDPKAPRFAAEVQARRVHLDRGLNVVDALVPLVGRPGVTAGGLLNARLAVHGQGSTAAEVRRTLAGHGSVVLDPIDLDGSRILTELRTLGEWPREDHVGSVASNFVVERGRVTTDDLTIRASKVPFIVAGWADFDGRFDYTTRVDKMVAALPRDAQAVMAGLQINLAELTDLRIEGAGDDVRLTLNGRPLEDGSHPAGGDRLRHRDAARRIRDRFFR